MRAYWHGLGLLCGARGRKNRITYTCFASSRCKKKKRDTCALLAWRTKKISVIREKEVRQYVYLMWRRTYQGGTEGLSSSGWLSNEATISQPELESPLYIPLTGSSTHGGGSCYAWVAAGCQIGGMPLSIFPLGWM